MSAPELKPPPDAHRGAATDQEMPPQQSNGGADSGSTGRRAQASDTGAAIDFLKRMAPQGCWLLSAIDPMKAGVIETKTFDCETAGAAAAWIAGWQGKRNIYFSINQPHGRMTKKAEKSDIALAVALHVDVDPSNPLEEILGDQPALHAHYAVERARILAALKTYKPSPSLIIDSGGGYQGFWLLREPLAIRGQDEIAMIEDRNRKIEKDLGGDNCQNIDRIMRLPGTINLPNKKKRAKGRVEAAAGLVLADWDRLYDVLAEFPALAAADARRQFGVREQGAAGQRRAPADWCRMLIENGLGRKGSRHHYNGDRSKAVWAVACHLARCWWSEAEIAATILNPVNPISEHVRDQSNPEAYAADQARKACEVAATDFDVDEKGKPLKTLTNFCKALELLGVALSYDELACCAMITGPGNKPLRKVTDKEFNNLYLRIDDEFGLRQGKDRYFDSMKDEAWANPYHPVRNYLAGLKWDRTLRLDTWLIDLMGVEDTPYARAIGAIVLIASVRRVRQPGTKFDEMLILVGEQGADKSTFLNTLAVNDAWFTDSVPINAEGKEMIEGLSGKWIVEAAELKGMRSSNVEHLKANLSRREDRARAAYERFRTDMPRQCVFFGTTNSDAFLNDPTGNRRFWPVKIKRADVAALLNCRDQLWAEAADREAAGASIRLHPDLWAAAADAQAQHTGSDDWEDIITNILADMTGRILISDAPEMVGLDPSRRNQATKTRMNDTMAKLGWERRRMRTSGVRRDATPQWWYIKGDGAEQRCRIFFTRDQQTGKVGAGYEGAPSLAEQGDLNMRGGYGRDDIPD